MIGLESDDNDNSHNIYQFALFFPKELEVVDLGLKTPAKSCVQGAGSQTPPVINLRPSVGLHTVRNPRVRLHPPALLYAPISEGRATLTL